MNNPYAQILAASGMNNTLLQNPFGQNSFSPNYKATLALNQIEGFEPIKEFSDDINTKWTLVKSSGDSTVDVPDPKGLQIVDYWNHEFPNLKTKLYVYVVEGIRQPRVETEQPTKILYQWFSTLFVPNFTPQMITEKEWLKSNVYAAPIVNSRVSKLKALCKVDDVPAQVEEEKLLQVDGLSNAAS